MNSFYKHFFYTLSLVILIGCGSSKPGGTIISTPVENIDSIPLKFSELTDTEKQNWQHLDLLLDTIPGMSTNRAYRELIKRKGQQVVVAVIDA
ncbi:MAG: peptidase S8, partial [Flavobacteriaceae bacterium]|nr:peptidase S8 [Flavobacteriaceae bacterium]